MYLGLAGVVMRQVFVWFICSISVLATGACASTSSDVHTHRGASPSSSNSVRRDHRANVAFQEIPTRVVARYGAGRYTDPAGWTITVPHGWRLIRFNETRTRVPIAGVEISNVRLRSPFVSPGYPLQVRGQDLPTRGIGLIIGNAPQPAVPLSRLPAPPLPEPIGGGRSGWEGVSNGGDSGLTGLLKFKLHGRRFIVSISAGTNPPGASAHAVDRIIRSLRAAPAHPARSTLASAHGATSALSSAQHQHTVVGTTWTASSGWIVVGPNRHALYIFCVVVSKPHCRAGHDPAYPPLIAHGQVVAAPESTRPPPDEADHLRIKGSELGTAKLSDGRRQVTYYGYRLYLYQGDHKPAEIDLRGAHYRKRDGGEWTAVDAARGGIAISGVY